MVRVLSVKTQQMIERGNPVFDLHLPLRGRFTTKAFTNKIDPTSGTNHQINVHKYMGKKVFNSCESAPCHVT